MASNRQRAKYEKRAIEKAAAKPPSETVLSLRAQVLAVLNAEMKWRTGRDIAILTGLRYKQTIDVLAVLHNSEKILRQGRTFTALWGPLGMDKPPVHNFELLQSLFRGFVVKDRE